jgi:hypothetical protein
MLALLLFLLDFIFLIFFKHLVIQALLVYFIISLLTKKNIFYSFNSFYLPVFLIFIQDSFTYNVCGTSFLILIPIISTIEYIKLRALDPKFFFPYIFVSLTLLCKIVILKKILFSQNIGLYETFLKIFVNLCITYLVLLGIQGNRSLRIFTKSKGRKVWTPNRMDAS